MELLDNIGINKYAIALVATKQPFYESIYSLGLMKLETKKVYIKIHPKTRFIKFFKFIVGISILFDKKLNDILY